MKNYKQINLDTYNSISKDWETKRDYVWLPVEIFLKQFENKNELKFIDLGCGSGRNLELAQNLGFLNKNILGIDFSQGLLDIVEEKGFQSQKNDLTKLNLEDNSLDVIICIAAHHHLLEKEEQIKSIQEMRRVLKQGGKLLLANWFPSEDFIDLSVKKKKFIFLDKQIIQVYYKFENKKYDRFYYLFKEDELKQIVETSGFEIDGCEHFKGNFYLTLK